MMKKIILVFFLIATFTNSKAQIKIGDAIPSITLKSNTNNEVDIISFKGKYVLVDFWASWCAPCRLGNKKLVKLHNEVSSNTVEIIGISIDTDISKWLKAVEKVKVIVPFNGYTGKFVFHCHNLEHEETGMMGQFQVS